MIKNKRVEFRRIFLTPLVNEHFQLDALNVQNSLFFLNVRIFDKFDKKKLLKKRTWGRTSPLLVGQGLN